jgi:hypothetical protein
LNLLERQAKLLGELRLREAQLLSVHANALGDEIVDYGSPLGAHEVSFPAESPVLIPKAGEYYQLAALPYRPSPDYFGCK